MRPRNRRAFLEEVGRCMLAAGIGSVVLDLDLAPRMTQDEDDRLVFGELEPLVAAMQDTPADRLAPLLIDRLRAGTALETLVAAGALANARTFGGQDYTGYHALMAMIPACTLSGCLPEAEAPLPVLKVLYRNTARIQAFGGRARETLRRIEASGETGTSDDAARLRAAGRRRDMAAAESVLAGAARSPEQAYESLQPLVRDNLDVHQVVLAWRAWDMIRLTGSAHAHTMLRQSVRHCVDREAGRVRREPERTPAIRTLLPRVLEEHGLLAPQLGDRSGDDAWVRELAGLVFRSAPEAAARAAAAALAAGFAPGAVGEALSLVAVRILLADPGSSRGERDKPAGSVHGASSGVHAADAVNAWRHIAAVVSPANAAANLVAAAWHVADSARAVPKAALFHEPALPDAEAVPAESLLDAVRAAIEARDQKRAAACVLRYGALGRPEEPLLRLCVRFAVEDDGALHHEKYFHTAREEFGRTRPAFRWEHLAGLARVLASGHGFRAPGLDDAAERLKR